MTLSLQELGGVYHVDLLLTRGQQDLVHSIADCFVVGIAQRNSSCSGQGV